MIGIVDIDPTARAKAAAEYQTNAFATIDEAFLQNPDIVALAVHPEVREEYWDAIWQSTSIKTIICEKPLADTVSNAEKIINQCASLGKHVYINYQRRANPTYINLRDELASHSRGHLQNVIIHYTHGLKSNACHWIDLALMLLGKPNWVTAEMSPIPSPYLDDPNATILLGYNQFHLHLLPLISPQEGFCSGDMVLTFEKERIAIPDPTMHLAKHAKRWIEIDGLLEETKIDFDIKNFKNDFLPFLNQVINDITTGQSHFENSNDTMQSLKIIKCAQISAINHCRVELD